MTRLTAFLTLLLITMACTCGRAQQASLPQHSPAAVFRFDHDGETIDLPTLMARSKTQDVSMAVDNGQQDSAFIASTNPTSAHSVDTRFPAGAGSALPVCIAVLQLVERGVFALDDPINPLLGNTVLKNGDKVTVRDVLLMKPRMGSSYKPKGFTANEPLPALAEVIREFHYKGTRPAAKGTEYGGWVLLQQLLEHHYQMPLNEVIQQAVFKPLCLEHSYYATTLTPAQTSQAASGHDKEGKPLPGGYRRYVAQADAGLWTTPRDYTRLTRSLLNSLAGQAGGVLRPETVQMALAERYGHRSLLFHMSDSGLPYWGGNAKGFYFTMQAHPEENWISVVMMNRDLNWRLGGPVVWQLGKLIKQWNGEERLGIILQEQEEHQGLVRQLEHAAFVNGIRTERLLARNGLPEGVTATPAFVFQSPRGRAVYGGRHDDLAAIQRFIRLSQAAPKKTAADDRTNVLARKIGRQTIILPLKVTPPTGVDAPDELPAALVASLREQLAASSGFGPTSAVALQAQDRRIYLDVHAYRMATGDFQLTYALFSQFNCHTPVKTSFGAPVLVTAKGEGLPQLTESITAELSQMLSPEQGFVPNAIPRNTVVRSWEALGWRLDQSILARQQETTYAAPAAVAGTYRTNLTAQDAPGLFFSFPAPLDRYAGEIREMAVVFNFSPTGDQVSGQVTLPVSSIATSSGSLDTYVLGDILKSKKFPTAKLEFDAVSVPGDWRMNQPLTLDIPATLTMRGKATEVLIKATFTPGAAGTLETTADFGIHFGNVFGLDGPDGPEAIRNQLDFTARFTAQAVNQGLQ